LIGTTKDDGANQNGFCWDQLIVAIFRLQEAKYKTCKNYNQKPSPHFSAR
jgi:hypothetical protein